MYIFFNRLAINQMALIQLIFISALSWSTSSWAQASGDKGITVDYIDNKHAINIKQCFDQAPDYIETSDRQITKLTQTMRWKGEGINYKRGYAELPEGQAGCVTYTIQVKNNVSSRRLKQQHPHSLLLKISHLLWKTSDSIERPLPKITINHDENTYISAPWQLINRTENKTVYQIKPTPRYSDGYVAFGALDLQTIMLGDSTLRLAVMHGANPYNSELIKSWVKAMASSVAQVANSFPLKDIQVLVVLIDGQGGAVPWGQVNRSGGSGVLFVVNANKSEQQLFADWTAAHEFSHLLTPYTPNDRWLSEGFASYHQNISRLRAGLLDENTAWSKLLSGFERGRKSASKSNAPTLENSNRRHNMQMYWGGAVVALKADVALQLATEGGMSLSQALEGLQDCCLETGKGWTARQLFLELDRISQTNIFTDLYQKEVKQTPYPEYKSVLSSLGIKKTRYGKIIFSDDAPMAVIRKRISKG